jgi:hypothetical protein
MDGRWARRNRGSPPGGGGSGGGGGFAALASPRIPGGIPVASGCRPAPSLRGLDGTSHGHPDPGTRLAMPRRQLLQAPASWHHQLPTARGRARLFLGPGVTLPSAWDFCAQATGTGRRKPGWQPPSRFLTQRDSTLLQWCTTNEGSLVEGRVSARRAGGNRVERCSLRTSKRREPHDKRGAAGAARRRGSEGRQKWPRP